MVIAIRIGKILKRWHLIESFELQKRSSFNKNNRAIDTINSSKEKFGEYSLFLHNIWLLWWTWSWWWVINCVIASYHWFWIFISHFFSIIYCCSHNGHQLCPGLFVGNYSAWGLFIFDGGVWRWKFLNIILPISYFEENSQIINDRIVVVHSNVYNSD